MRTDNPKYIYRLLDAAFTSLIAGVLVIAFATGGIGFLESYIWPVLTYAGAVLLAFSVLAQRSWYRFFGIVFTLVGTSMQLAFHSIIPPVKLWWPVIAVFVAAALLITGGVRYRKITAVYLVPSIALVILGGVFLCFSLRLVPLSFRTVVVFAIPALVLGGSLAALMYFFIQRKLGLHTAGEVS